TKQDSLGAWTLSSTTVNPRVSTVTSPSPASNKTVYTSVQNIDPDSNLTSFYTTQIQKYQGASTLLSTTVLCYNGNQTNCASIINPPSVPFTQTDYYLTIAGMSSSVRSTKLFDGYSNVIEVDSYDFGASSPTFKTQY